MLYCLTYSSASMSGRPILLLNRLPFTLKRPVVLDQNLLLSHLGRDLVDFQILKEMDAAFAGGCKVDVAVAIEVGDDELRPHTGSSVHRDRVARELCGLSIDLVV